MDMDEALEKVDNLRLENIRITRLFNKFDYNINFFFFLFHSDFRKFKRKENYL